MIKCALVQCDPQLGDKQGNLAETLSHVESCAAAGARLVVFPECNLSGYCFTSRQEGLSAAETIPGPSTEALTAKCRQAGTYVAAGLLEKDGDKLYNSAVLISDEGELLCTYRKTHLPHLGVDRFVDPGPGPLLIKATALGRIGLLICYDLYFPEPARVLMLGGAEMLVVITNWPNGREAYPDFVIQTRARDNHLYVLAANRVGIERGTGFFGRSQVCDPDGKVLAEAAAGEPEVIYAELEPRSAGELELVLKPGEFELDLLGDRRPDLYGPLVEPLGGKGAKSR